MNNRKDCQDTSLANIVIAVALCLQVPLGAWADDTKALAPEAAKMETTQAGTQATSAPSSDSTTLHGAARKHLEQADGTAAAAATQNQAVDLSAEGNGATLQSATGKNDAVTLYGAAVKKINAGQVLSAEEYRDLGAGCTGFEAKKDFFQNIAKVIAVYPGSPAEKAGIRIGDKIIEDLNPVQAEEHPDKPLFAVVCGQAGTPKDVTLLRDGKPVKITLIRMNIEDIQDPQARHKWEQFVRHLDFPTEGTFIAPSIKSLEQ
jgi:C-terminal processing protease CtpA/Prc